MTAFNYGFLLTLIIGVAATPLLQAEQAPSVSQPVLQKAKLSKKELIKKIQDMALTIRVQPILASTGVHSSPMNASGFWIDGENGIVVTNAHVASEDKVAKMVAQDSKGNQYDLHLIWSDPLHDVAFLKANKKPAFFTPLDFNLSPEFGQPVLMAGNNGSHGFTVCEGLIGDNYSLVLCQLATKAITVSLNGKPGSSGSPVLDESGYLIGVNYSGSEAASFVVPAQYLKYFLTSLKKNSLPERWGFNFNPKHISATEAVDYYGFPADLAEKISKEFPQGENRLILVQILIDDITGESPFQVGDILYTINGKVIGPDIFIWENDLNGAGATDCEISVYRLGKLVTFKAKPKNLNSQKVTKMVVFGEAVFSTTSPQNSFYSNHPIGSVGIFNNPQNSIFSFLPNLSSSLVLAKIISINGQDIQTLERLIEVIPSLIQQEKFVYKTDVSFIFRSESDAYPLKKILTNKADYDGSLRQPPFIIEFDASTHTWKRTIIDIVKP